jgi:hypothetical protein
MKAKKAAEDTQNLSAKAGRAAYVEQTNLANVCDPGEYPGDFKHSLLIFPRRVGSKDDPGSYLRCHSEVK